MKFFIVDIKSTYIIIYMKLIYLLGAASDVNQDYVAKGVSNQTGGQDVQDEMKEMNQTVKDEMTEKEIKNLASLVQSKMKSDGGFSQPELKRMFSKSGLDASPNIAQFNDLDTNKNGKLEDSEIEFDNLDTNKNGKIDESEVIGKRI